MKKKLKNLQLKKNFFFLPISEHLFEYIGTQLPPPSAILYGKMSSITMFVTNGYIRHDTTIYAFVIDRHFIFYFISYCIEYRLLCETL
jgi:hypothetical protein